MSSDTQLQLSLSPSSIADAQKDLCERLNPEQTQAVMMPMNAPLQVMAGAGTGKTEVITRRFIKLALDLSEQGVADPTGHLWACTFTEKAAQEMRTRIQSMLGEMAVFPLTETPWIGTFHSLCRRVLQAHGEPVGFSKQTTLLTDLELEVFQEQCIQLLMMGTPDEWLPMFLTENVEILCHTLSAPALLTLQVGDLERLFTDIVCQIIPRIKSAGLSPEQFYQMAVEQHQGLWERVQTMPPDYTKTGQLFASHQAYADAWESHLKALSYDSFSFYPTRWDTAVAVMKNPNVDVDEDRLLKESLKPFYKSDVFVSFNGRKKKEPWSPPSADRVFQERLHALDRQLMALVHAVYCVYQGLLQRDGLCDFDDLIQKTLLLFETQPDIKLQYQTQFKHFIVDEFQDSNASQLRLIQCLTDGAGKPVTLVGDSKQSIYGFRYAEPANLQVFFDQLSHYETITLGRNYRSQKSVLTMANDVTTMMGYGESAFLQGDDSQAYPVTWLTVPSDEGIATACWEESLWIGDTIDSLLKANACDPQDVAVLVRSHAKTQLLEEVLTTKGIPVVKQRNLGFFDFTTIRQAMALLTLMVDPDDPVALMTLLQSKLSQKELGLLVQRVSERWHEQSPQDRLSYWQCVSTMGQEPCLGLEHVKPLLEELVVFLQWAHRQSLEKEPEQAMTAVLNAYPYVLFDHDDAEVEQKQLDWLKKAVSYWLGHVARVTTLEDVLDMLSRARDKNTLDLPVELLEEEKEAVRLMTVHGAKGLEFPVVFLAGVEMYRKTRWDGPLTVDFQYPGKAGFGLFLNTFEEGKTLKKLVYDTVWHAPRSEAEELRLLYVAVTRAKERLYVSSWDKSFPYLNPQFFKGIEPVYLMEAGEDSVIQLLEESI